MNESELKTGDLIYFLEANGAPDHIALYVTHKDGVPYVIHATSTPYNSVMLTRLNYPASGSEYRVMRPANNNLAYVATGILLRWVAHQIKFATEEKCMSIMTPLSEIGGFLDNPEIEEIGRIQESHGKATYALNYHQYFSMIDSLPLIPEKAGSIEGLFCSEAIVAAFNIALLIMHEACIRTLVGYTWSPDPRLNLEAFIALLDNPMPFDAQKTLPAGMFKYCVDNKTQWHNLGRLRIERKTVAEDEAASNKASWIEFRDALRAEAPETVRRLMYSPGGSPHAVSPVLFVSTSNLLTISHNTLELESRPSSPLRFLGFISPDIDDSSNDDEEVVSFCATNP